MFELIIGIFAGFLLISYDFVLNISSPGTLIRTIFSMSHIWSVLGIYIIFISIFKKKKGYSFYSTWKTWVKNTVKIVVSAGLLMCAVQSFVILTPENINSKKNSKKIDYVIVLGGGIDKYGRLPDTVLNRVEAAAEFIADYPDSNLVSVVTGGQLKNVIYPEAPTLKKELLAKIEKIKIAENKVENKNENNKDYNNYMEETVILVEDKSLDTIQNFQYSCKKIAEYTGKSQDEILQSNILVVTSSYHLARALRLAKRMGFSNVYGLKAKVPLYKFPQTLFMENCSYLKLNLRILLTGKPKRIDTNGDI